MSVADSCSTPVIVPEPSTGSALPPNPPILGVQDPPPPYPYSRIRAHRPRRHRATIPIPPHFSPISSEVDHAVDTAVGWDRPPLPTPGEALETTPLLTHALPGGPTRQHPQRPRSGSYSSTIRTSSSRAPSLVRIVWYLFDDEEGDSDLAVSDQLAHDEPHHGGPYQGPGAHYAIRRTSVRWSFFSRPAWTWYLQPLCRKVYYAAVFHLLVLNFPYALVAWIYLFVFTLTGTILITVLPIGALLCFLDLLGARVFARGELALQTRFHGPLAYPPYPPQPIFRRTRPPRPSEVENGREDVVCYETSFYRNTYTMFTDATTYQALFYFLVIKPGIALGIFILLIVLVPVSHVLVLPVPLVLRLARKLGIWQANVAVDGLYYVVS